MRVGKEVSFMPEGKTIGQLMEEMRQKAGAAMSTWIWSDLLRTPGT